MTNKKTQICTIFDKGFLIKGLTQYKSLQKYTNSFTLWILCLDSETYEILKKLNLKGANIVRLEDVEDGELLSIKNDRTTPEYSWTLKAPFIQYIFKKDPTIKNIFYVDGDIAFFADPKIVLKQAESHSIGIRPHDFPEGLESRAERTGIYNAGFVYFKNDEEAKKCLDRWRGQCIEWCYARHEDGKSGDQKYLDEWPELYKNIKIFDHKGINFAPWNASKYQVTKKGESVFVGDDKLVFYHFHQFKILENSSYDRSFGYTLPKNVVKYIYNPYEDLIEQSLSEIRSVSPSFSCGVTKVTLEDKVKSFITKFYLESFLPRILQIKRVTFMNKSY